MSPIAGRKCFVTCGQSAERLSEGDPECDQSFSFRKYRMCGVIKSTVLVLCH